MFARLFLLFPIVFYVLIVFSNGESDVLIDYYEQLIKTSIEESKKYVLPANNLEYIPETWDWESIEDVDFAIIGAGTAGSIIANRLSEVEEWKIIVIEAGTFGNNFTDIPVMSAFATKSKYKWGFLDETSNMKGRKMNIPKGKGVGGSTIINGLRYVRGSKEDFDYWNMEGNSGWSYEEVLPYFKKLENVSIYGTDPEYRGFSGPLSVEHFKSPTPHLRMALEANEELGYSTLDYNGKSQIGFSPSQQFTTNGKRANTGNGYVDKILNKENVKVLDNSYVIKIVIDDNKKEATDVIFSREKKLYRVKARKEIILSAGAVGSPHILMLSGVGPKSDLETHGINVIQDLSVGKNLIDHPTLQALSFVTNHTEDILSTRDYIREYLDGYGFYTIAVGIQGLGFYKTKYAGENEGADVILDYVPANPALIALKNLRFSKRNCVRSDDQGDSSKEESYRDGFYQGVSSQGDCLQGDYLQDDYFQGNSLKGDFHLGQLLETKSLLSKVVISIVTTHPKSRGIIKLKSKNPFEYPSINLNILSDEEGEDVKVLYEAVQLILKIYETDAFKRFNASLEGIDVPACKMLFYNSEEFWKCVVRELTIAGYHLMGTCKMGIDPSSGAVVNHILQVHGIQKLRVADASVIIKTSGYPGGVTMMIGEKVSDMIKADHGVTYKDNH